MENNSNFETYLFISIKKFIIRVSTKENKKIYEKELIIKEPLNNSINEELESFLSQNIFKIEKIISNFIKEIFVILDSDQFFPIEVSIKKKNFERNIDIKSLNYLLNEAKDCCKKTIDDKRIIHMLINNYQVDNKNYDFFPQGVSVNTFSFDVKFICLTKDIIENLEKILKKYFISLNQVLCADYIGVFLSNHQKDIFHMAKKIINGHNQNEVKLINKLTKKEGFFERFFNFFS